jgi:CHAT domain-containing protein
VSSYIPTLHSLIKAKDTWTPIPRNELAGVLFCEESLGDSVRYLPAAAKEVHIVRECFKSAHAQVLNCESLQTLREDMLSLLQDTRAHVLHLACHAIQNAEPLNSAILLHDGKLTIEDIVRPLTRPYTTAHCHHTHTTPGSAHAS